ncbi:hypothetical protein AXG93_3022s1020 [Marchantia polymorpha subsp. ruderalis]|uniref:Uncharacterized protein n=1 Tax=Marchantia polymorpha subsp. ruderalis TaxID=1480154 RepID=A0A176VD79_MARPO|nr:hypothetical protein AXG93_3022s1020 [Marchantia polymorpha subsp. ruderalis]
MTEDVPLGRDKVPLVGIRMKAPFERPAEVLAMSSDTKEDLVALEKVAMRAIEDVGGEAFALQKVLPLLQYLDLKCAKYAGSATNRSYMELVRNRTRAKVAASSAAAAKEQQNQATEAKYERLNELTATSEKKEHEHAAELTAKIRIWQSVKLLGSRT